MQNARLVFALLLAWLVTALSGRYLTGGVMLLDPFLLLTVYAGARSAPPRGTLTGLAAGLTQDALTGTLFGLNGFTKTLVGYLSHGIGGRLVLTNAVPQVVVIIGATLLDRFGIAILSLLLRGTFPLPPVGALLLLCLFNALVGVAVFRFADARERRLSVAY